MTKEQRDELFTKYQQAYHAIHPVTGDLSDEERLQWEKDADAYAEERIKEDIFRESSMGLCN